MRLPASSHARAFSVTSVWVSLGETISTARSGISNPSQGSLSCRKMNDTGASSRPSVTTLRVDPKKVVYEKTIRSERARPDGTYRHGPYDESRSWSSPPDTLRSPYPRWPKGRSRTGLCESASSRLVVASSFGHHFHPQHP